MDSATHYENILQEIERKFAKKIEVSNRLSIPYVKSVIQQHGKRKVLVQLGANHADLFYHLYRDVQEIAVAGAMR